MEKLLDKTKNSEATETAAASSTDPAIKSEKATDDKDCPKKQMAIKVESLKKNITPTLMKYQQILIKHKQIKAKGEAMTGLDRRVIEEYLKNVTNQAKKITTLVKTLERLIDEEVDDSKITAIICAMEKADRSYEVTLDYAKKFQLEPEESSKKRRKTSMRDRGDATL